MQHYKSTEKKKYFFSLLCNYYGNSIKANSIVNVLKNEKQLFLLFQLD